MSLCHFLNVKMWLPAYSLLMTYSL
jgi:hypothetical protein